jgi:hypothetical protein
VSASFPTVSRVQPATPSISLERIAGFASLTFALLVAVVNVATGDLSPPAPDASTAEIVSFFADTETVLKAAMSIIPIPVIALYLFLSGAFPRLGAASPKAGFWARVGAVGLVLIEVMFLARTTFELVLLAKGGSWRETWTSSKCSRSSRAGR